MAFTQLLDRSLNAEGRLCVWCPTRDLLALVTADDQLVVHRLNWQRLWSCTTGGSAITALEWRPDGKQLAVGTDDGTLMLLNTEDGEMQKKAQLLPDGLVAISWTEAAAAAPTTDSSGSADSCSAGAAGTSQLCSSRVRYILGPPPPPVPAASSGMSVGYNSCNRATEQAWPVEPTRLALLACASSAGHFMLCTSGLSPLASVQLPRLFGQPSVSVLKIATHPSLQQLTVVWRSGSSSDLPLQVSTISMQHCGSQAAQLHCLAQAVEHVNELMEGCRQGLEAACKEWKTGLCALFESSSKLAGLMSDHGANGEPASELQRLLTTGAVGGALQQYITAILGEHGLKKLARTVDAAVCSVHNLLTDHMQPRIEQLACRLGELRGLTLCVPWQRATGLQPHQIGAAEQMALKLVMQAEVLRQHLVLQGAQYRTFFAWLLVVQRRMQEDAADILVGYPRSHLESVADFLSGQFRQDTVGPMLDCMNESCSVAASCSLAAAGGGVGHAGSSMHDVTMEVLGRHLVVQAADSTAGAPTTGRPATTDDADGGYKASLAQQLQGLQQSCSAAFARTVEVMSPMLSVSHSMCLGTATSAVAAAYLPGCVTLVVAAAMQQQPLVLLVRSEHSNKCSGQVEVEAALVNLAEGVECADVAIYKEGQLAMLLAGAQCHLILLPQDNLNFVQLHTAALAGSDVLRLCQVFGEAAGDSLEAVCAEMPDACRKRTVPYPSVHPPLAISTSRGVGCVLAGTQRVLLFDMEEDQMDDRGEE